MDRARRAISPTISAATRTSYMSIRRKQSRRHLCVEELESGTLLSAGSLDTVLATPLVDVAPLVTNRYVVGLTPAHVRHAYGFDRILFGGHIVGDGAAQTIAIVD